MWNQTGRYGIVKLQAGLWPQLTGQLEIWVLRGVGDRIIQEVARKGDDCLSDSGQGALMCMTSKGNTTKPKTARTYYLTPQKWNEIYLLQKHYKQHLRQMASRARWRAEMDTGRQQSGLQRNRRGRWGLRRGDPWGRTPPGLRKPPPPPHPAPGPLCGRTASLPQDLGWPPTPRGLMKWVRKVKSQREFPGVIALKCSLF